MKKNKEVFLFFLKFWGFNVFIPFLFVMFFVFAGLNSIAQLIYYYIVLVAPVVFFTMFYGKIKQKIRNPFLIFAIFFITPYLLIYAFTVYAVFKSFQNFGF